jgi:hypothetical protein
MREPRTFIGPRALPEASRVMIAGALGVYAAAIALAPKPTGALILAAPLAAVPAGYWALLNARRWVILFFAAVMLLPPLPLGVGNSGPHPAVVFVLLGLLAGVWGLGEWRMPATPLGRALMVFFFVLLASVAQAAFYSGVEVAIGSLTRVLLLGISVYVYFYTAHGPGARDSADTFAQTRLLFWLAAISALFACVDFYYQFPPPAGYGAQFIWLRSGVYRRAQGLFYEASTLGNFCAFFLTMIGAALVTPGKRAPVSRRGMLAGGIVFGCALALSFSRASILNLTVAVVVLIGLHRQRVYLARFVLPVAGALLAGGLVLRALLPEFTRAFGMRIYYSITYAFSATEGLLSGRVTAWRTVLDFLARNPWHALFGVGYKTLPYTEYLGRTVITDNMYLSLLAETGIVGLGAMLWLSVEILRAAGRAAHSPDARRSFFGSWICAFWAGQMAQMFLGDSLTYWRVVPLYFWVLALAVRDERSVS